MSSAPLLIDNVDALSRSNALKARILPSLLAGILGLALFYGAGLLLTVVQSIQVIPTLLQAEVYEQQATTLPVHTHAAGNVAHEHEAETWRPQNGLERTAYTAAANISLAVGFALLLGAAGNLRGGFSHWRNGLLWGLAGYTGFFVAPSLGLPPEVPGTETANLKDRQLWWLMTVVDTAAGLWLLVFSKTKLNKLLGLVLLVSPHWIGAPQPEIHSSAAPAQLAHTFIIATALANAVFWLVLGCLMGLFSSKHQNR